MYCATDSSRYKDSRNLINLVGGDEFSPHQSSCFQPDVDTGTYSGCGKKAPTINGGVSKQKNFEKCSSNKSEESGHVILKEGSEVIREVKDGMVIERNHKWTEKSAPCSSGNAGSQKQKSFLHEENSEKTPGCSTTGFERMKPGFEKHANSVGCHGTPSSLHGWSNSSPSLFWKRTFTPLSDPGLPAFSESWEKSYSVQPEKDVCSSGYEGQVTDGSNWESSLTQPATPTTVKNPAEKSKTVKKARALVLTKARKALIQEFRETGNDGFPDEKWQHALLKFMVKSDPKVSLADIKRWVKSYRDKKYDSLHLLFYPDRKVTVVDVQERKPTQGKKEEKASKTPLTDDIVCKTRSVFVWFDDRKPILPNDVKTLERAIVKRLMEFSKGQVEKRQFLPETQRFHITFGRRGTANEVVISRDKPRTVNDRAIRIHYAPPPSLLYTFQEKYFDRYCGKSKFPLNELRVALKQLKKECDIEI